MAPALARLLLGSRVLRRVNTWVTRSRLRWRSANEARRRRRDPDNLTNFEKRIYSQNGEDGILAEIFRRIGTADRFFVEIGVGYRYGSNEVECNTRNLLEHGGWSGIWVDASTDFVAAARRRFAGLPLRVEQEFVLRETILNRMRAWGVAEGLDLLSIDIDGNDYWVWQELSALRPRVLILEYNGALLPGQDWVMEYNPDHRWDATYYFGASLDAYTRQCDRLGYRLVGCDSNGINAFFVRGDCAAHHFGPQRETAYYYHAPKRNPDFYGFPPSPDKAIRLRRSSG
jgi:hypothetical protein